LPDRIAVYAFSKTFFRQFLEAVLNCLFEGLRVKNFSFDRFFQGRKRCYLTEEAGRK